jgi:hypothetical protein
LAVLGGNDMPTPRGKIPRINYVAVDQIKFSDKDWKGIEDAYGRPISPGARALIVTATNALVRWAAAENTSLMEDALERVKRLHKQTKALVTAIGDRPPGDVIREYVDDEIALSHARQNDSKFHKLLGIRMAPLAGRKYVVEFLHDLNQFASACELAQRELCYASKYNYWRTARHGKRGFEISPV